MRNKLKLLPLAAAVLFAPAYAEEEPNTYVGASVGQVSSGVCDDAPSGVTCEDEGLGFRGFGGREFGKYLALEMGITHASKVADVSGRDGNGNNVEFEVKYNAFDVGFVGRYPFNDTFAVSAYIGSASWRLTAKGTGVGVSDDGTGLRYGFGVEISPAKSFRIRGEWSRLDADGDDVDYLSLSAAYRF